MKNIFIYVGIGLLIIGSLLGAFTGLDLALWLELAGAAVTLALCIKKIHDKAVKKDWKLYAAIAGVVIGVILLVWGGIATDLITSIIAAVIGLVVLILSIIPTLKNNK